MKKIIFLTMFILLIPFVYSYNQSSTSYIVSSVLDSGGNITDSTSYKLDTATGLQSNKTISSSFIAFLGGIFYYIVEAVAPEVPVGGAPPWIPPTIGTDYLCNITFDFIIRHTIYGELNYSSENITDLQMRIFKEKNFYLMKSFLENYIQNYEELCGELYFNKEIKTENYEIYFNVLQSEYLPNSTVVGKITMIYLGEKTDYGNLDLFLTNCWTGDIFLECQKFSLKSFPLNFTPKETKVIKEMIKLPVNTDLGLWRMNMQYQNSEETFKLWDSFKIVLKKRIPIEYIVMLGFGTYLYIRIARIEKKIKKKKKEEK